MNTQPWLTAYKVQVLPEPLDFMLQFSAGMAYPNVAWMKQFATSPSTYDFRQVMTALLNLLNWPWLSWLASGDVRTMRACLESHVRDVIEMMRIDPRYDGASVCATCDIYLLVAAAITANNEVFHAAATAVRNSRDVGEPSYATHVAGVLQAFARADHVNGAAEAAAILKRRAPDHMQTPSVKLLRAISTGDNISSAVRQTVKTHRDKARESNALISGAPRRFGCSRLVIKARAARHIHRQGKRPRTNGRSGGRRIAALWQFDFVTAVWAEWVGTAVIENERIRTIGRCCLNCAAQLRLLDQRGCR